MQHVGLQFDMSNVEFAPTWLLSKLSDAQLDEVVRICTVLWGIWFWRYKKVWESKSATPAIAMEGSIRMVTDWREAKRTKHKPTLKKDLGTQAGTDKWSPPSSGQLKLNVDASVFPGADSFSLDMVLRDHHGSLLAGKVLRLSAPASVFEAETIGVREALSWIMAQQLHRKTVLVETDSLLTMQALHNDTINYLEVEDVIVSCQLHLQHLVDTSVSFIRKQSNRVAHEIAKLPCLVNCQFEFTSPPCLLETLLFDDSK